jgi:hypothetical protein
MPFRVQFELPLSPNRLLNLSRRHFPLLDQPMGKNRGNPAVKEVEHAVIYSSKSDPQLVNAIP